MSTLKAGFARTDLNPPLGISVDGYFEDRKADGFRDRLHGSCIALSDGENTAVVFSIDLIGIRQKMGDDLRRLIAERTGLPYEAVFYACTHTHTAPATSGGDAYSGDDAYNSVLFRLLADAACEAVADLSDAEIYTNRGEVKDISFIRRYKMKNGRTQTNPGLFNPEIDHPISTPDEMLQLVRLVREGKDDIVILNFQCHPDVIGGNKYSADWPGFAVRAFEGAVPGTKCVLFNGAQGDTNHVDVYKGHSGYDHSRHMGMCIAGEAMKLYTYAEKDESEGTVGFMQYPLNVPTNRAPAEAIPEAERLIKLHEENRRDEVPFSGMEYITVIAEAYHMKKLENWPDIYELHLCAVRFGNVAFTGIPGEPFTDVGRAIKEASPFKMTIPCCCANGAEAYYPMKEAYDEGGYEARSAEFASGVAELIIDGSLKMLNELY